MLQRTVLPLALFALALLSLAVLYGTGYPVQDVLFNSDAMYLPALFADLFDHGGKLQDWYLTPAPYFFPDFLLYGLAFVSTQGTFNQVLLFGLFQLTAMAAAAGMVFRCCVGRDTGVAAALIGTAVVWLAMHPVEPALYALISAHHFGTFLASLGFVALWLHREIGARHPRRILAGMCLLAYASALSDNLFLVQTMGPFMIAGWLMRHRDARPAMRRVWPYVAAGLAALAGSVSYRWVVKHPTRMPTRLGWSKLGANFHDLADVFTSVCQHSPLLAIITGACLVLGSACCMRMIVARRFLDLPRPILLLLVFATAAMAANLCALVLSTNLAIVPRYLIAFFLWPVVLATVLLAHWSGHRFARLGLGISALCVASLGYSAIGNAAAPASGAPGYPEQIACIDRALAAGDAHRGIAQYWDAKHIQAFSRRSLTIAQYMKDMNEHRWITSSAYFHPGYDFAVLTDADGPDYALSRAQIVARSGAPKSVAVCGNRTVLLYEPNQLRMQNFVNPGEAFVWQGCNLPTQIGTATGACAMAAPASGAAGYLTFGPYEQLGAGEYTFDLDYSSDAPAGAVAGAWDMAITLENKSTRLKNGNLAGTAGHDGILSQPFIIDQTQSSGKVEVRTVAARTGQLRINSLRITRVH